MDRMAGRCVLIVEDDFFIAADLAEALTEAGAVILGPAGSVAEALDLITRAGQMDAAVLDVNLRREKVYPISDMLARRRVPCVLLTGDGGAKGDPRFAGLPVLAKPMRSWAILSALTDLLSE